MRTINTTFFLKFIGGTLVFLFCLNLAGNRYFDSLKANNKLIELKRNGQPAWELRDSNQAGLNDLGMREPLDSAKLKELNRKKVVVLGNSVVFGFLYPLEKTLPKQIERLANLKLKEPLYAVNAGFDGYEIYREFAKFKEEIVKINPQMVIWVPSTNDILPFENLKQKVGESKETNKIHERPETLSVWDRYFAKFPKLMAQKLYLEQSNFQENFLSSPHNLYYTNGLLNPVRADIERDLRNAISEFSKFLKQRNIAFVSVFIPSRVYARMHRWEDARSFLSIDKILKENGVKTLNFFEQFSKSETNLYSDFVHLNEKGHEFLAAEVVEAVFSN